MWTEQVKADLENLLIDKIDSLKFSLKQQNQHKQNAIDALFKPIYPPTDTVSTGRPTPETTTVPNTKQAKDKAAKDRLVAVEKLERLLNNGELTNSDQQRHSALEALGNIKRYYRVKNRELYELATYYAAFDYGCTGVLPIIQKLDKQLGHGQCNGYVKAIIQQIHQGPQQYLKGAWLHNRQSIKNNIEAIIGNQHLPVNDLIKTLQAEQPNDKYPFTVSIPGHNNNITRYKCTLKYQNQQLRTQLDSHNDKQDSIKKNNRWIQSNIETMINAVMDQCHQHPNKMHGVGFIMPENDTIFQHIIGLGIENDTFHFVDANNGWFRFDKAARASSEQFLKIYLTGRYGDCLEQNGVKWTLERAVYQKENVFRQFSLKLADINWRLRSIMSNFQSPQQNKRATSSEQGISPFRLNETQQNRSKTNHHLTAVRDNELDCPGSARKKAGPADTKAGLVNQNRHPSSTLSKVGMFAKANQTPGRSPKANVAQ